MLKCPILCHFLGISIIYSAMALCGTTIYSLLPIVIIELIGKEHLINTMGIYYVYQGLAFIVSTVVASKYARIIFHWYWNMWIIHPWMHEHTTPYRIQGIFCRERIYTCVYVYNPLLMISWDMPRSLSCRKVIGGYLLHFLQHVHAH